MNTFALILFAFPFYLAVNGKLTNYTALATTAASTSSGGGPANPSTISIPGLVPSGIG